MFGKERGVGVDRIEAARGGVGGRTEWLQGPSRRGSGGQGEAERGCFENE